MALQPHPGSGLNQHADLEETPIQSGLIEDASSESKAATPSRAANQSKGKTVVCRVTTLHNANYEIEISKTAVGQELFDAVVKERMHLEESAFFSLSFEKVPGTKFWLNMTKKIEKQLQNSQWVFFLEFKFYPPEPNVLSLDETRFQLVLQVRQDMLSGRLPCSFYTYAVLGSYTAQSELGDFDPARHGKGIDYLRSYLLAPNQSDELLERVHDLHRLHKGIEPPEADLLFLATAKKLALYGVTLYKAKEQGRGGDQEVLVGVSPAGLYIYDGSIRMSTYKWPRIRKMSYKYNVFNVKAVFYETNESTEELRNFKCASPKLAKRLWRISVETHQFFRLKQAELTDTNILTFGTRRNLGLSSTLYQHRQQQEQGTIRKSRATLNSSGGESVEGTLRLNGSSLTSDQLLTGAGHEKSATGIIEDSYAAAAAGLSRSERSMQPPPRSSTPDHGVIDELVDEQHAAATSDSSLLDVQPGLAGAGLLNGRLMQSEVDQLAEAVGGAATSVDTIEEASDSSALESAATAMAGKVLTARPHNGPAAAEVTVDQLVLGMAAAGEEQEPCEDGVESTKFSLQSSENRPAVGAQENSTAVAAEQTGSSCEAGSLPEAADGSQIKMEGAENQPGVGHLAGTGGSGDSDGGLNLSLPGFSTESFGISATGQIVDGGADLFHLERNEKFTTESNSSPADRSKVTITVTDEEAGGHGDDQALLDAIRSVLHLDLNLTVEKIELQADSNYRDV